MATNLNFAVVANNGLPVYIQALDDSGSPVNISGFTIKWQVRAAAGQPALITKSTASATIAIINATQGIFGIPLLPADTVAMPQGYYIHEAVTTDVSGNPITITNNDPLLTYGTMYVRQQYTAQ